MDTAYSVYREILIWDNKNRRAEIIRQQRKTLARSIALVTLLTSITVAAIFWGTSITPKASSESPRIKYYTTYSVGASESLYNISRDYVSSEYSGVDEYMHEVCLINHIDDASDIKAGDMIVLPYYSSEFKE
ncbi:hypothetical protein [Butyrivibrio sp. FCS014]|uniref:hypothetical protein n=1 Tax=Butyrivibrio sp. FCS014 TaxID=1408304 RepID=UPI000467DD0E|nr:hypothetical protein [Butyrivibrio sp. FCS014]